MGQYEDAKKRLEACAGDCKHCDKCHIYIRSNERATYYAFGCDLLPLDSFDVISDSMEDLRKMALETINFELI